MSSYSTQRTEALAGRITPEMQRVAELEYLSPETVREEMARGRMVIPANRVHLEKGLDPAGIGIACRTKINANLGNSPISSGLGCELAKVNCAIQCGADTVMDLSTGTQINEIRQHIIDSVRVPVGTVPMYQIVEELEEVGDMTPADFLRIIEEQAKQGVDYMTVHCALLREHLPLVESRTLGIVSRGGSLVAQWMALHKAENPFYTHFSEMCEILRAYDVTWSLGDGLRPGCLADASDAAQFAELKVMGDLTLKAWEMGCQVMIEGPGHVPLDQIEMNVKNQIAWCHEAPFYVLGPLVTDIGAGYDHITSAIGGTLAAFYGVSMLCYVTPKEHLGLPNLDDVRAGVIAHKIAAHAADVARGRAHARDVDDDMSRARAAFDWEKQFSLSLDPENARRMHEESIPEKTQPHEYCSMCGPKFCSIRNSRQAMEMNKNNGE